jgi:hypothetical protein
VLLLVAVLAAPAARAATTCPPTSATWSSNAPFTGQPYGPNGMYYLNNGEFALQPTSSQIIWKNQQASTWGVCAYQPLTSPNNVKSNPSVNLDLTASPQPVSSYTAIAATFSETNGANTGDWQYMCDVFAQDTGGHPDAIEMEMVTFRQQNGPPPGTKLGSVIISNQTWTAYRATALSDGHTYYQFILSGNETSGTVHLLSAFKWLHKRTGLSLAIPLESISSGWEISDVQNNGAPAVFTEKSFSTVLQLESVVPQLEPVVPRLESVAPQRLDRRAWAAGGRR